MGATARANRVRRIYRGAVSSFNLSETCGDGRLVLVRTRGNRFDAAAPSDANDRRLVRRRRRADPGASGGVRLDPNDAEKDGGDLDVHPRDLRAFDASNRGLDPSANSRRHRDLDRYGTDR